ncbi:hypothetical protein BsWGS_23086 [Bradybaena similaris]
MVYSLDSQRSSQLLALVLLTATLCSRASCLGYRCFFGPMIQTVAYGQLGNFCPTTMEPPFMRNGDYLVTNSTGTCYECMCTTDGGLACCDCPRPRRRG